MFGLGEGGRGSAGAGACGGGAGGSVGGCWGVEYGGEGEWGNEQRREAVNWRGCQRVVAGIVGAGGGCGNDRLSRGDDRRTEACHGAVVRAIAAAAGGQARVIISQRSGQGAEEEDEHEQK